MEDYEIITAYGLEAMDSETDRRYDAEDGRIATIGHPGTIKPTISKPFRPDELGEIAAKYMQFLKGNKENIK